ncbi:MAG: trigger factor [Bacteroidales bacterium]|nr:trigger factor [Bacteroidales bacterium]
MNITQESTGDLTATIKLEMMPEDYEERVNKALKDMQKSANLKGFRPGHVPFGLVKKMYGKSVMADEINKLISDSLNNYLEENKIDILGYPLGNPDKNKTADFDNDTHFEFFFDIGLTPQFELEISDKLEVDYYDIQVEDKFVDNYVDQTRQRFGNPLNPESIAKGDLIKGEFVQLDGSGNLLENGVKNVTSLGVNFIKDENVKNDFLGKKQNDKVRFNPLKATENATETASMLNIKKEDTENLESDYEFTIHEISRIEPAAMDQDFFSKVYPGENIESEEQFREKLREEGKKYYQKESDNFFVHSVMDKIMHETEIPLPDEFVKQWLIESDDKITAVKLEKDYDKYADSLKQQLIINKLSKDHGVKVDQDDIKNHVKNMYGRYFGFGEDDEEKSKQLDSIADSVLKNKEEVNKIYDELFDNQVRELFKTKLKLAAKKVTYEEFVNIVNEHHKVHHHEHE